MCPVQLLCVTDHDLEAVSGVPGLGNECRQAQWAGHVALLQRRVDVRQPRGTVIAVVLGDGVQRRHV